MNSSAKYYISYVYLEVSFGLYMKQLSKVKRLNELRN